VFGFLDGTMLRTARPAGSALQGATYSGYLRGNGGKVLAIVAPDGGMTMAAYVGSVRSPDQVMAVRLQISSNIDAVSRAVGTGVRFVAIPPPLPLLLSPNSACSCRHSVYRDNIFRPTSAIKRDDDPNSKLVHRAVPGCVPRGGRSDTRPRRGGDGVRVEHAFGGVKNQV